MKYLWLVLLVSSLAYAADSASLKTNSRWTELKPPTVGDFGAFNQKLLGQVEANVQSHVFNAGGTNARLDIWSVTFAGQERKILMLETAQESFDLTPKLTALFHCPPEDWQLENLRFTPIGPDTTRAVASAGWSCAKSNFRTMVSLEFEIKDGVFQTCESRMTAAK